ncbi:hypothetical protein ACGH6Q_04840 [Gilliamella sp. BG2]|uniref:hypothetical protein n=1 Tax=Gilliamella sp. BG2 TaxID=3351509 RepID=UPI003987BB8E
MILLLLSSLWNVQANGKKVRTGNRSDAIIIPSAVIHYARPNLYFSEGRYAGPADIWNPKKGFLVQSIDPESYNLNFPTTGANFLFFDLVISGDFAELTWEPVTHEGITARMKLMPGIHSWVHDSSFVIRVMLTGPDARNQWDNPHPNPIAKPKLPQTFELVGRDRYGIEVVKYGFVLKQWFVVRDAHLPFRTRTYSDHLAWCNNIGYQMPRVRDLTNAVTKFGPSVGDNPSSPGNHYMRHIDAGLSSEWGYLFIYTIGGIGDAAGFLHTYYWTSDVAGHEQFIVDLSDGSIGSLHPKTEAGVACVSNLKP